MIMVKFTSNQQDQLRRCFNYGNEEPSNEELNVIAKKMSKTTPGVTRTSLKTWFWKARNGMMPRYNGKVRDRSSGKGIFIKQPLRLLPAANIWPADFTREDFLTAFKALMETQKDLVMHDAKFLAIKKDTTNVTHFDLTHAGLKTVEGRQFYNNYMTRLLQILEPVVKEFLKSRDHEIERMTSLRVFANIYEKGRVHGATLHTDRVRICTAIVNLTGDNREDALWWKLRDEDCETPVDMQPGDVIVLDKLTPHGVTTHSRIHERISLNIFYGYLR